MSAEQLQKFFESTSGQIATLVVILILFIGILISGKEKKNRYESNGNICDSCRTVHCSESGNSFPHASRRFHHCVQYAAYCSMRLFVWRTQRHDGRNVRRLDRSDFQSLCDPSDPDAAGLPSRFRSTCICRIGAHQKIRPDFRLYHRAFEPLLLCSALWRHILRSVRAGRF